MRLSHPSVLRGLHLCLKAGNRVYLMPRSKGSEPLQIVNVFKRYVKHPGPLKAPTKLQVELVDGRRIDLIAGDKLTQMAKYGAEWEMK